MISIVVPAYNVSNFIKKTINSVISQSDTSFEVIIVDDGSIDNTYEVVQELLLLHKPQRFKLIKKENGGVSSARNKGIDEANGSYVLFLDGDDYISDDLIKYLVPICNENEPDIVCWGYDIVNEDSAILSRYEEKYFYQYKEMTGEEALKNIILTRRMHIWTGSALYKKEFLDRENLRFTEGCSSGEDQEFILKCLSLSSKVIFIPKTLTYYVQRENSLTNVYNINRFEAIEAIERAAEFIKQKKIDLFLTIKDHIQYELILENFLFNFNSCLSYLLNHKKLGYNQAIKYLIFELENRWTGLYCRMQNLIEHYKGKNLRFLFKIKCFKISPVLYFWMLRISNIRKHIKSLFR